jgi:hypothetical protein
VLVAVEAATREAPASDFASLVLAGAASRDRSTRYVSSPLAATSCGSGLDLMFEAQNHATYGRTPVAIVLIHSVSRPIRTLEELNREQAHLDRTREKLFAE